MKNVYTVKLDKNRPYKISLVDDAKSECQLIKSKFNELSKNYFRIDTNHDATTNLTGIADENKAIKEAFDL
jgi:hypothetical protein